MKAQKQNTKKSELIKMTTFQTLKNLRATKHDSTTTATAQQVLSNYDNDFKSILKSCFIDYV